MSLSLNKPKLDNLASDIWKSAERLRGKFKAYEYQASSCPSSSSGGWSACSSTWREDKAPRFSRSDPKLTDKKELAKLVKELELNPKQSPFSNKTDWTLRKVYEEDHTLLEENFRAYINGFSKNVDDIIEHFNYRATIGQMVKNNRLAPILNQYKELELGPDNSPVWRWATSTRNCSGASRNKAARRPENTSPRAKSSASWSSCWKSPSPKNTSPSTTPPAAPAACCPSAKEHLLDRAATPRRKRTSVEKFVTVHGQELSPTNYAICQADLLIKNDQQAKVYPRQLAHPPRPAQQRAGRPVAGAQIPL